MSEKRPDTLPEPVRIETSIQRVERGEPALTFILFGLFLLSIAVGIVFR